MKTRMGIIKKWITLVLCAAMGADITLSGAYTHKGITNVATEASTCA